ncbi:MAG: hypothetical protein HGB19_11480 [Chlorobiales bacterium]|nr:hypothetical protein [Chlorobiales bacterium]
MKRGVVQKVIVGSDQATVCADGIGNRNNFNDDFAGEKYDSFQSCDFI